MSVTVYQIAHEGPVGILNLLSRNDNDMVSDRLGQKTDEPWIAPETRINSWFIPADIVGFGPNAMAFTPHTVEALRDQITQCADMLPVKTPYGDYAWFNCTQYLDCVIQDRIEGTRDDTGKYWLSIDKWEFDETMLLEAPPVFRTTVLGYDLRCFCTDSFKSRVEEAGLVGMKFTPVWNSETGGILQEFPALLGPEGLARGVQYENRRDELSPRFGIFYP